MQLTMWYRVEQLTLCDDADRVCVRLREESNYGFQIVNRRDLYIGPSETWFELEMGVDDNDLQLGQTVMVEIKAVPYAHCDHPPTRTKKQTRHESFDDASDMEQDDE